VYSSAYGNRGITTLPNGGPGRQSTINGITYAGGGGGSANYMTSNTTAVMGGGTGGTGSSGANSGQGGTSGANGSSGIVVVQYSGTTQRATGGTISVGANYVRHTFSSSGTFTLM
jgi:hypothetical protein